VALCIAVAGCRSATLRSAGAVPSPARGARTVIVLGFDGFARRYLDTDSAPALHALARTGVAAHGMIPSFPTITFPNFYALATGLYPDHSGIVNNRFFDPAFDSAFEYKKPVAHEAYWWGGEPIWVTATKQGAPAATMFWVGSDAAVSGVRPELWHSYDHAIQFSARVDTMLAWLDLPAPARPRFVMGYFEEPDMQGHHHGPDAPETHEAVLRVDSAVADPGWMIAWRHGKVFDGLGEHGYDNASPDMRALFLARGPDFKPGTTIDDFPNVDVYDLLAPLLGINPAPNDGTLAPFLPVLR
jgi:predicted AlkP superfamily pyrophosphatase or phosphodiesterase